MRRITEGIILKSFPYGEADLIVTALTLDYGIIKIFARSPRKTKSRFGSSLEPFSYNKLAFFGKEDAKLPKLVQSDIIDPFQSLRNDLSTFYKTAGLLEITLNLLPERSDAREVYSCLLSTLSRLKEEIINRSDNTMSEMEGRWILFYKIKLLQSGGISPRLTECAVCARAIAPAAPFYLSEGAVICDGCVSGRADHIEVSSGAVSLYNSVLNWQWDKLGRIRPQPRFINELNRILDVHIEFRMEKGLYTKTVAICK